VPAGRILAPVAGVLACVVGAVPAPAAAGPRCDRVVAPGGSDAGPGTNERPLRTVERLARSLRPGETGCVLRGTYAEDVTIERGGRPGAPIRIRGVPARGATLRGILYVAHSASDVVIQGLRLDGANTDGSPSPQVNGGRVTFAGNDVTNRHTSSCFILGGAFERYGIALGVRLLRNRIHDCGRLPATGHDHGIYVEGSTGALIRGNVIRDNADYGIHLYPRAYGSRIERNIIHRNGGGLIFAGESGGGEYGRGYASSRNVVARNVIAGSLRLPNVDSWWPGPHGTGNRLVRNCLWGGPRNIGDGRGFRSAGNVVANPRLSADRHGRLRPESGPCARVMRG
jgi:parallel beta-helix repeat protein